MQRYFKDVFVETRNVFIDIQAIMRQGFKFENPILSKLSQLGKNGKLNILISEVVRKEVASKILEKLVVIEKAKSEIEKAISIVESEIPSEVNDALMMLNTQHLNELAVSRWEAYIRF